MYEQRPKASVYRKSLLHGGWENTTGRKVWGLSLLHWLQSFQLNFIIEIFFYFTIFGIYFYYSILINQPQNKQKGYI